jgi:hypothetical protein
MRKRVLLQVGIAFALLMVLPYTFLPQAKLDLTVLRAYQGPKWLTVLEMIGGQALPWVVAALPAALVSWWLIRRPWDALAGCGVLYVGVKLIFRPQHAGWASWLFAACDVAAMALCCWAVAAFARLQDRKGAKGDTG